MLQGHIFNINMLTLCQMNRQSDRYIITTSENIKKFIWLGSNWATGNTQRIISAML